MDARVKQADLDPVTLEVIRNALPAISNEMSADLQRTSYNMMIYEVRDYCTALVNPKGELVSQNVGGVSHFIADLGVLIEDAMKRYGKDGFKPGDVLITNHQAVAGQHLNNVVIHLPFFFEGELVMFAICRAHWIDVGGSSTGFGSGPVADPWLEGLQFDQLKIYEAGELNEMLYRMISDNIRFPESSLGDLKSQIAACRLALRRLDELFAKYGRDTVVAAIDRIFDETEQRCRKVVSGFKDGVYEARSRIDDDGITAGKPYEFHVTVTIKSGEMSMDFTDCPPERQIGWNARTLAAPRVAYKALTLPNEPVNEGSFRALHAIIPEGNMMMARYPIAMSGWSTFLPTVVDTVVAAVAPAMPDRCPAAHHGNLGGAIFHGVNPNTKRRFMLQTIEGGGWGGRPTEDGESASVSVCQGDVRNASIEATELKVPIVIERRGLRIDSGGAGKNRGGLGTELRVRNLMDGRLAMRQPKRLECPPWGLWNGEEGATGKYYLKLAGDKDYAASDALIRALPANSEFVLHHPGGGGWGDPLEREPERVRWDVMEDYVSREAARDHYGVVVKEDLSLDEAATTKLRSELRTRRKEPAKAV
jgi:N-methylhydantoinase B